MTLPPEPLAGGRFISDTFLTFGSAFTSEIWTGTDLDDGRRITIKKYVIDVPGLFDNEVRVHNVMRGSSAVVQMLHHERKCIVKQLHGDGINVDARVGEPSRELARRALLASLEAYLAVTARGQVGQHAACANNIVSDEHGVCLSVDVCCSKEMSQPWGELERMEVWSTAFACLRSYRGRGDATPRTDWTMRLSPEQRGRHLHTMARLNTRRIVSERDHELFEALVRFEDEPRALRQAVERLC